VRGALSLGLRGGRVHGIVNRVDELSMRLALLEFEVWRLAEGLVQVLVCKYYLQKPSQKCGWCDVTDFARDGTDAWK